MEHSTFLRALINHEVRHHVAVAFSDGVLLRSSAVVDAVLRAYPRPSFSAREIADIVIEAAFRARVPVEMGSASKSGFVRASGIGPTAAALG